jgi:hypothetical protein
MHKYVDVATIVYSNWKEKQIVKQKARYDYKEE